GRARSRRLRLCRQQRPLLLQQRPPRAGDTPSAELFADNEDRRCNPRVQDPCSWRTHLDRGPDWRGQPAPVLQSWTGRMPQSPSRQEFLDLFLDLSWLAPWKSPSTESIDPLAES